MKSSQSWSLATAALLAISLCRATQAVGGPSVLIVHADAQPPTARLQNTGLFSSVTEYLDRATPTLAELSAYDSVLVYTGSMFPDPAAVGDVLADYVDAGGHLVIAPYSFSSPWAVTGRIATTGYSPLIDNGSNDYGNLSGKLDVLEPQDPIFDGVDLANLTYFYNQFSARPLLDAGASLLATDGAGVNMIARSSSGVVGLNLYPADYFGDNANLYRLIGNALLTDSRHSAPETGATGLLLLSGVASLAVFRPSLKR